MDPGMSEQIQRYARNALDAYEQGFRVIAGWLNDIMAKHAPGLRVNADPPEPGITLADASQQLRNALLGLRPEFPDMPGDEKIYPWSLGYAHDINSLPVLVGLVGYYASEEEHIAPILRYLDEKRSRWPSEMWQTRIVAPVEEYADEQREPLRKTELTARFDSPEAIVGYVDELRRCWPEPEDYSLSMPATIFEELWGAMYRIGLSLPPPPEMVSAAKLGAALWTDDGEARKLRGESWREFHDPKMGYRLPETYEEAASMFNND
jgi:hypothetical protein